MGKYLLGQQTLFLILAGMAPVFSAYVGMSSRGTFDVERGVEMAAGWVSKA
jgi:hypothetical protein